MEFSFTSGFASPSHRRHASPTEVTSSSPSRQLRIAASISVRNPLIPRALISSPRSWTQPRGALLWRAVSPETCSKLIESKLSTRPESDEKIKLGRAVGGKLVFYEEKCNLRTMAGPYRRRQDYFSPRSRVGYLLSGSEWSWRKF